jgi:hypothetical protein
MSKTPYEFLFANVLMRLKSNEPMSALQKLAMCIPSTNDAMKSSIDALITKIKSPSVITVTGSVSTISTGRTRTLSMMRNTEAITAGTHPVISIPGTTYETTMSAPAVMSVLKRNFILKVYSFF